MKKELNTQPIADIMDAAIKKLQAIQNKGNDPSKLELKHVLRQIHEGLTDRATNKTDKIKAYEIAWKLAIENLGIIKTNNVNPLMNDILKTHGLT